MLITFSAIPNLVYASNKLFLNVTPKDVTYFTATSSSAWHLDKYWNSKVPDKYSTAFLDFNASATVVETIAEIEAAELLIGLEEPGFLLMASDALTVYGQTLVGFNDEGKVYHAGGTLRSGSIGIGVVDPDYGFAYYDQRSKGLYQLKDGTVETTLLHVGYYGDGEYIQTGGTTEISKSFILKDKATGINTGTILEGTGNLLLGYIKGGVGVFTMTDGNLSIAGDIVNGYGTGTLNIDGGNVVVEGNTAVDFLNIGNSQDSLVASYSLDKGQEMTIGKETIGNEGYGFFTHLFGKHIVEKSLKMGVKSSGRGNYEMQGGTLNSPELIVGGAGEASFDHLSGTVNVGNTLILAEDEDSKGKYLMEGNGAVLYADNLLIGNAGAGSFIQDGGSAKILDTVTLGIANTGSGSYVLNAGELESETINLGFSGEGQFTQTGGTNTVTNLSIADNQGSEGSYLLEGGDLKARNTLFIGYSGIGEFIQTGGSNFASTLILGETATGKGSYTLDAGKLQVTNLVVGNLGVGEFNQSNIILNLSTLSIGVSADMESSYTLNSGSLLTDSTLIADAGKGSLLQMNGTHKTDELVLGAAVTADGKYELHGGDLQVKTSLVVGKLGKGTFTQFDGTTNAIQDDLILGSEDVTSIGSYELNGGDLSAYNLVVGEKGSGIFEQKGGNLILSNDLKLANGGDGTSGIYTLSDGVLSVAGQIGSSMQLADAAGVGTFNLNGGQLNVVGDYIRVDSFNIATELDSNTTYQLDDGNQLIADNLTIGSKGTGALYMLNGSEITTNNAQLGGEADSEGNIIAFGGNWNNSGDLTLGSNQGEKSALVVAGGDVNVSGDIKAYANTLVMASRGTLLADNITTSGELRLTNQGILKVTNKLILKNNAVLDIADSGTVEVGGKLNIGKNSTVNLSSVSVHANSGLTNRGLLNIRGGTTDIYGAINNKIEGSIIVSGNGAARFNDDVVNNGTELRVESLNLAEFFGGYSGDTGITGGGTVYMYGGVSPGNSPGLQEYELSLLTLGDESFNLFEIGGLSRGVEYDGVDVTGNLVLGGTLEVDLYDLGEGVFSPEAGSTFDLFSAEDISGDFDYFDFDILADNLVWELDLLTDVQGSTDILRLSVLSDAPSSVPVPAAVWLFGSALVGLIGVAKRRKA